MKSTTISYEEAERRELHKIGLGQHEFHVTLWGDSAPKVQFAVAADDQATAEQAALEWGRNSWWRDRRKIGIEKIERVLEKPQ